MELTAQPMSAALCQRAILTLTEQYPFITSRVLTTTAFGRPVQMLQLGRGERKALYTAAFHGNEWITATVMLKFVQELAQALQQGRRIYGVDSANVFDAATLYLVPLVNPDGVDLVTGAAGPGSPEYETAQLIAQDFPQIPFPQGWKANAMGVDLNLQFPAMWEAAKEIKFAQGYNRPAPRDYVGRAPLSQRESFALARLALGLQPDMVLAYHTQGREIYWQFQGQAAPSAQRYAQEFARLSGYSMAQVPYQSGFAGFKDWIIQDFQVPAFTIEAGSGENPLDLGQFDEIYRENLGILVTAALGLPGAG